MRFPNVLRGPGRSLRRTLRRTTRGLIAARATWDSGGRSRRHAAADGADVSTSAEGRRFVLDHGYRVPTVTTTELDHARHAERLQASIRDAITAAGGSWTEIRSSARGVRAFAVRAEPAAVWTELNRSAEAAGLALTVQPGRPGSPSGGPVRRTIRSAVGVEFADTQLRPDRWGAPQAWDGPPPDSTDWLVASHASSPDLTRHIGTDAGVELRFGIDADAGSTPRPDFPIDVVYTWVDCFDPEWRRSYDTAVRPDDLVRAATTDSRFNHLDELRYSLRSVAEFAPWVNHIFLVTAGHVPAWLDLTDPRITLVTHEELWAGEPGLPTFNSQAIEAALHRIPGLSEHFLYFNDDMLIGRPVGPDVFFDPDGRPRVFTSTSTVPDGDPDISDLAPDAAGKNNRRLVTGLTGRSLSMKYQHAPYALRKSVIVELERQFGPELAATRRAPFRSLTDVTVAGGLHHSYALATGQAVVGDIRNRYIDLESPDANHLLDTIARYRWYESFCVNVVLDGPRDPRGLVSFLQNYFPNVAEWESDHGES